MRRLQATSLMRSFTVFEIMVSTDRNWKTLAQRRHVYIFAFFVILWHSKAIEMCQDS